MPLGNSVVDGSIAPVYISEEETQAVLTEELALEAARNTFAATLDTAALDSLVIPASDPRNRLSVKPGVSLAGAAVKVGSYWPGNEELGLPRHHSTVLILDQRIGRVGAVLEMGVANAYRTAAADALAVELLSRTESSTLAIFGTGHQALYEVRAIVKVRPIERVLVVGRTSHRAQAFAEKLTADHGIIATVAVAQQACSEADVIVTSTTNSTENDALFQADWIRPGTHISAMGADGPGKRELPAELLGQAELFCDIPEQSRTLGEFKAAPDRSLTMIGEVLTGAAVKSPDEHAVTVFDSSGIGLQDLYLGLAILEQKGVSL